MRFLNTILNLESTDNSWTNRRILWLTAAMAAIVTLIWHAPQNAAAIGHRTGEIFFVFVMAASLCYLMRPSVNWSQRTLFRRMNPRAARTWATALVFVAAGVLLYFFVAVALKPVTADFRALWNDFVAQTPLERRALIDRWQNIINTALAPYSSYLPEGTQLNVDEQIPRAIVSLKPRFQSWVGSIFTHATFIVELLLLPVLVFYFLSDGAAIRREAGILISARWKNRVARMADDFDRIFGGYIRGQVWMCVIAWIVVTLMLLVLRVPHAATLGLIAGITRAIPVIGPLLGAIPLGLVCLLTTRSMPITLTLLGGFVLMHFIESKVLLPKIIGHEVDLHPVSVIIVLLLGLEFFGFLGVFLSVPVAALFKVLLLEWQEWQRTQSISLEIDRTLDEEAALV
jgi:predicted PurR-regulated permease PerM